MELLHSYINSSENQVEPQVWGFCRLFRKKNGYEFSDEFKKRLENEWFGKCNFSLSTDGKNGEQVVKV